MIKKQSTAKKLKKKKWFPILAPKWLGGGVMGETLLAESESMKDRCITMNLMNITGDPKKQTINLQFKIKDVREGQGVTEMIKYELVPAAVKRLVRRGRSKIDDSFAIKTKYGVIRAKTLTITNTKVYKSIETKIRLITRQTLKEIISKNTFEKNIEELLKGTIQKEVKTRITKVTPTRVFNIRILKLENKEGAGEMLAVEEPKQETTVIEAPEQEAAAEEKKEPEEKKPKKKAEKKEESEEPAKKEKKKKKEEESEE